MVNSFSVSFGDLSLVMYARAYSLVILNWWNMLVIFNQDSTGF